MQSKELHPTLSQLTPESHCFYFVHLKKTNITNIFSLMVATASFWIICKELHYRFTQIMENI